MRGDLIRNSTGNQRPGDLGAPSHWRITPGSRHGPGIHALISEPMTSLSSHPAAALPVARAFAS